MRDSQTGHYVGLDIGTSKIRCVIGMDNPDNPLVPTIIGYGESDNIGIRKGVISHVDDVADAVLKAITEAERISGVPIRHATANINGVGVVGIESQGVIAISSPNREITADDCMRVEEAATILQLPSNKEIVQVFAKNYRLDGQENIKDPVGMHGIRLEVDSYIIAASIPNLKNLSAVLGKANVGINHLTVSGLAAAEATLTRKQKESGTLLLDIGASTTNLAILEDGEIQHVGVIPVGGMNVTNDLAIGLRVDLDVAEEVKLKHANLKSEGQKEWETELKYKNETYNFSTTEIEMIVEARLEELMDFVAVELSSVNKAKKLPGGVVVVGGTSKIPGIDRFIRDKLELPARLGRVENLQGLVDVVSDPAYCTANGLMMLDMLLGDTGAYAQPEKGKVSLNLSDLSSKLLNKFKRPKSK